ncbi:MAG: HAD-IB family phosphatase [Bacteroidota bacterium]|nr:HAD-IB family phosphatase [Bacteroidota bacterium]
MKNYRLKIFCDFDGTIAKNDVRINSLGKFITNRNGFDVICDEYYSQKISLRDCNLRQLALVENFSLKKFNEYLTMEEVDDYFKDFVSFCRQNEYDISVLSGGLEYYIDFIFKRESIDVKYSGCKMIWNEKENILSCEFLHTDEYCKLCETCKRNILINNTNDLDNEISVYIGDGVSDYCVSGFADIVFAKGRLASYCWKNNITYFEYADFLDIKNKIIKLTGKNKFKQRREAMISRRDIIMGG